MAAAWSIPPRRTGVESGGLLVSCRRSTEHPLLKKCPWVLDTEGFSYSNGEHMHPILAGSLAGFAATAPMTLAMEALFTQLPKRDQQPLPPQQITERLADSANVRHDFSRTEIESAAMFNHFAYGTAAGALYGALDKQTVSWPYSGVLYGLGVWTISYMGLLPAANILPPATRMSANRNGVMIAAHVVWGLSLGWATRVLRDAQT